MCANRLQKVFQQSIRLSQDAFEMGAYDAAYHLLVAALDSAKELNSKGALLDIANTARAQLAWIDTYEPDHKFSTHSAAQQGQASVLMTLAGRARLEVKILQLQTERQHPGTIVRALR